jgi:hypothetical protein
MKVGGEHSDDADRRECSVPTYQRSLFGREPKAQANLVATNAGLKSGSVGAGNSIALNQARKQITFSIPLLRDLAILTRRFAAKAVPSGAAAPIRPSRHLAVSPIRQQLPPSS